MTDTKPTGEELRARFYDRNETSIEQDFSACFSAGIEWERAQPDERLTTIIDENFFGLQPVYTSREEQLTALERLLFERRQREETERGSSRRRAGRK